MYSIYNAVEQYNENLKRSLQAGETDDERSRLGIILTGPDSFDGVSYPDRAKLLETLGGSDGTFKDENAAQCHITAINVTPNYNGSDDVDIYFDVDSMPHKYIWHGVQSFYNCIQLHTGTENGKHLAEKRLAAIEASNPGCSIRKKFHEGNYNALIGLKLGVVYGYKYDSDGAPLYDCPITRYVVPTLDALPIQRTTLVIDDRQGCHYAGIHQMLAEAGWALEYATLPNSDYVVKNAKMPYYIDTKHGIGELAGNLTWPDSERFHGELFRAHEKHMYLVVNTCGELSAADIAKDPKTLDKWENPACRHCHCCDPLNPFSVCQRDHEEKPLSGAVLRQRIEDMLARHADNTTLLFVDDDEAVANVIDNFMRGQAAEAYEYKRTAKSEEAVA